VFSSADALRWKIGPLSEATIGHVGLHTNPRTDTNRTGLDDYVMNGVGGVVFMMLQDFAGRHVQLPLERRFHNVYFRNTTRIFTGPCQSLANLMMLKAPWRRD
jgi:hypothetical protein